MDQVNEESALILKWLGIVPTTVEGDNIMLPFRTLLETGCLDIKNQKSKDDY